MDEENKEIEQQAEEVKEEIVQEPIKEEPVEEVKTGEVKESFINKTISFVKAKWMWLAGGLVAIIILIIAITSIAGAKTKAIKKYISGYNSKNVSKIINSVDFKGMIAWKNLYVWDIDDFKDEDYEEFIKGYKDVNKDEIKEAKEEAKDSTEDLLDDLKDEYKSYKITIKKIKKSKKLGKDLYATDVRLKLVAKPKDKDEDDIDSTKTFTFVTYKNKLVYSEL